MWLGSVASCTIDNQSSAFLNFTHYTEMDPLSITTGVLTIVVRTIGVIQSCSNYASKYNISDLAIASIRTECSSIRVALLQIQNVVSRDPNRSAKERFESCLLIEYEAVLGACSQTFSILNTRLGQIGLDRLNDQNESAFGSKLRHMWKESQIDTLRDNVRGLAIAINLLVNAFQS